MAERALHRLGDDELEMALRGLEPVIAWPDPDPLGSGMDLASEVRGRIERGERAERIERGTTTAWGRWTASWRPARRALVLALVALLALAAIAGAVGLGLPGLRIILGEPPGGPIRPRARPRRSPPTDRRWPPRSPRRSGRRLRLGDPLDPADPAGLDARAGFAVRWPADPSLGPPDAAWIDDAKGGQVTLLWAADRGPAGHAGAGRRPAAEPSSAAPSTTASSPRSIERRHDASSASAWTAGRASG